MEVSIVLSEVLSSGEVAAFDHQLLHEHLLLVSEVRLPRLGQIDPLPLIRSNFRLRQLLLLVLLLNRLLLLLALVLLVLLFGFVVVVVRVLDVAVLVEEAVRLVLGVVILG